MSLKNGRNTSFFTEHVNQFKTVKTSTFTHTSIMNPIGSFYIPGVEEDSFLDNYNDALKKGELLHFTERHRDISPILIDLDFRYENNEKNKNRQHTIEDINEFINIYISELYKYVDISKFEVYIMEKSGPVYDCRRNVIKDGVHIIIQNVITKLSLQLLIRDNLLEKANKICKKLNTINDINDIFDKAVIDKNNWTMYGSRKPYNEPYMISHHYTYTFDDDCIMVSKIENPIYKDTPWIYTKVFSIRNKLIPTKHKDTASELIDEMENRYQNNITKQIVIMKSQQTKENRNLKNSENYELAKSLILILKSDRADSYQNWIGVGWCVRNIDNRLLPEWIEFSKKSSKFVDENECEKAWRYMKDSGLGLGTLCMWAKSDNVDKYNEIMRSSLYSLMLTSTNDTDYDIAMVIYNKFKQDFVCASIRNRVWYEFKNHRWVKCEDGYVLKMKMSTEVSRDYLKLASEFAAKAAATEQQEEQEQFTKKNQLLSKIANKLKRTDFKDKMLKECASLFFNEKFEDELLDANPNLIGFENGVYDLSNLEFREGHPEDYISFSTKINFIEYDPQDQYIERIMEFMSKVLPNKAVREYMLTLMSSMLDGNNKEEKFYIWTGHGSNGKSKCIELLEKVLGDYACTFNITLLTSKRVGSSQTNSELVRAKGRRFAVLQEPEEGEKINAGFMKELSGNDKIIARGLYKESIEFKPMFKMVLTCNHLPSVPPEDGGTWRRIRLVEFDSHFCENPNPANKKEFHIDRELAFKFDDWRETFMSLLIHYFKMYKDHGIYEPTEVLQCTKNYQRSNDVLGEFMDTFIIKDENKVLILEDMYSEYKEWHKTEAIGTKLLRKKGLKEYFDKHFAQSIMVNGAICWNGYCIKLSYGYEGLDDDNE
jgi:P4 family phage/plasmid primase-like protien